MIQDEKEVFGDDKYVFQNREVLNGKGTCGISTQLLYKPKITKSLTLLIGTSANLMFVSQVITVGHH